MLFVIFIEIKKRVFFTFNKNPVLCDKEALTF